MGPAMKPFQNQTIEISHEKPPRPPARQYRRICQVCGKEFDTARHQARFCGDPCKIIFNNIRRTRGAVLYDFFMMMRYDRAAAEKLDVWSCMCALGSVWRTEDKGRDTWGSVAEHLEKMPYLKKTPDITDQRLYGKAKKKAGD